MQIIVRLGRVKETEGFQCFLMFYKDSKGRREILDVVRRIVSIIWQSFISIIKKVY